MNPSVQWTAPPASPVTTEAMPDGGGLEPPAARRHPWIVRRWPTWLAIALTVVSAFDAPDTVSLAQVMLILPLGYLIMAVVRRRRLTWVVVIAGLVLVVAVRLLQVVDLSVALLVVSAVVLAIGVLRHSSRTDPMFWWQVIGLVLFATASVIGSAVDPALGRWIVAAGWLGHGVWDLIHLRRDQVVSRSFAEWCGVFDIGVALQLVLLAPALTSG